MTELKVIELKVIELELIFGGRTDSTGTEWSCEGGVCTMSGGSSMREIDVAW